MRWSWGGWHDGGAPENAHSTDEEGQGEKAGKRSYDRYEVIIVDA